MNAICPMCLRSNPTSALFCYFDGVSLSHQQHEQPSNIGDVPFTIPFVLPGGTQCLNFNQLVLACQNNWQTAREILAQGRWVKYFAGLGRADLAEAARIAAQDADLDRGLSQFLERLPADTLEPAKLLVEPAELIFDHLMPGKDDGFELMAVNQGMLLLYGVATSNCDWLAFDERGTQSQKLFQTMHRLGISVRILGNKLRAAAKPMEAEIVIESNGGTMKVPIRAEIAIRPFATGVLTGARSPREIAAKAKAQPKDAIPLFDSGAVKAWYQTNGWTYPISAPCIATGAGALQQFLELLGLTKPPRLAIDTEQLRFSGKSGKLLIGQIVVSTQENVPVFLHAVSDQEWLTLQAVKSRNGKATLPFEIVIPPRSGETLTAQITIEGNGKQQFVVPVRLTIADKPLMGLPATPANKPLMGLPATPSASSVKLPTAEPGAGTALPPMAAVLDPAPAAIDASIQPSSIVGSSGKRLTTLVRDAVEAAVGQAEPRRKGINELNVLALTVGLIGLAVTWPFGSAGFGILLAASGLASACIAMLLLLIRRGTAYTLPALGALINAQGLAMALILYWYPPKPPVEQPPQLVVGPAKPNFPAIADVRTALASTDPAERVKGVTAVGELARNLATTRVDLLTALQDPDETVRAAAADALGQMGPPARVTFPVLLRIAKTDASENARKHAEQAMKKINSPNRTDLSEFLVALTDDNAGMRAAAALALGQIGPEARDAAAALDKALGDSDVGVCVCAAQALWEIQRQQAKGIVKVLVDGLQDKTRSDARARAADVLGRMRSTEPKALDALETALRDGEADVRIEAAFALGSIGAPRSMPKFVKALGDSEIKVRMVAAQALWLYEKDVRGVSVLIKALDDADADIRVTAAVALGKFGEKAEPAVHALALALKDRDAGVRARAAEALHHIGPAASLAVPALREALHNPDASLRSHAAYALSAMKAEARPAIPELRQALQDQDTGVRLFAARALWAVDGKADVVLPVIVKILREEKKDALQRARGAATLGFLGARAASVVPELHDALFDPDGGVRAAAARAIGEIGGAQARVAYPTLTDLAKADQADEAVRAAASEALKRIGRPTKADLDTLIQALAHNQPRFRASAAVCLWLMNREAKRAAFALGERLADKDENVSTTAAYALASIGPDAAAAVPALRNALKDKDEGRRGRAAFTLGEIGPNAGDAALDLNQLLATETEKPIRFHAARALWTIAKQTTKLLPVLASTLAEDDAGLKIQAAELLGKIAGELGDPKLKTPWPAELKKGLQTDIVPPLVKMVEKGLDNQRGAAAGALGALGLLARPAVPALLQVLEDEDAELRAIVAETLGKIGAAENLADKKVVWARAAYPALFFYGRVDQHDKVQRAARGALDKIGVPSPDDVDVFVSLLQDKSQPLFFRNAAGQVLAMIGPDINRNKVDILPRLGEILLQDENASVRSQAVTILGEVGARAESQSPALVRALKDTDFGVCEAAARALGEIYQNQKAPPDIRAALNEAANSPDENVAVAAGAALKKMKK